MRRWWLIAFLLLFVVAASQGKQAHPKQKFKVVSVGIKVEDLSSGTDTSIISWKVVVESELTAERKSFGKIKYLDSDGFEVDGDMWGGCIAGGEQKTLTGQTLVSREEVKRIVTTQAEILDDFPCD